MPLQREEVLLIDLSATDVEQGLSIPGRSCDSVSARLENEASGTILDGRSMIIRH